MSVDANSPSVELRRSKNGMAVYLQVTLPNMAQSPSGRQRRLVDAFREKSEG
jgi:hypothetical protein